MSALRTILSKVARKIPFYRELLQIKDDIYTLRAMESVRIRLEIEGHSRYSDPKRLPRYALSVNSQDGEDGIIHEIFRRIGVSHLNFVEIGVGDGFENNTSFLLSQGWKGWWIDASNSFVRVIHKYSLHERLRYKVAVATRENITPIFRELGIPKEFDLLSIDIDQNTYYIWEALADYSPRVVVVECNTAVPPDVDWKVTYSSRLWDGSRNFGASLKAFEKLGARFGYCLVGCNFVGSNAFFVRDDLVGDLFAAPYTAENHYEPPRYAYIMKSKIPPAILDICGERQNL